MKKNGGITTKDIALRTGLSKMTVSRVLNNHHYVSKETKKKVLDAVEEMGFRPNTLAKRFFTGKTQLLGMVIPLEFMFHSFYFKELFQGVIKRIEEKDYDLMLHDARSPRTPVLEKCLNLVQGKLAEGLLICAPMDYDHYPLELTKQGVPLVVLGATPEINHLNRVYIPNRTTSFDATSYLIGLGHRHIAALVFEQEHIESYERRCGYREALEKAGLPYRENLVGIAHYDRREAAMQTMRMLEENKEVTAVFAMNLDMALGASDAIKAMNLRIPDDISLLVFDDSDDLEKHDPPVSAIRQYPMKMGYAAADMLFKLLDGELGADTVHQQIIETEMIMRDSVAPPRER